MGDDDLSRELAYYKRHLDDLAAERISFEHQLWALHRQVRQKTLGFQLLSKLALSFGARSELASMFQVAVLAINSALEMDRTAIFVPAGTRSYRPMHCAGLSAEEAERIAAVVFEFPENLQRADGLLLVDRSSAETPLTAELRRAFGVETFICVPILAHSEPLGIILSGRLPGQYSLFRAVGHGDVDTFRAITGMLQAVTQHTRLALLEQTEHIKSEFFADVAHEFRTPLTLTLGPLAQILAGKWGDVPEAVSERLRVVERNQERLLGLINQILDLARLEASAAELRPEPIADVNELVSGCAAHFRAAAEARGLELKLSLDATLSARPLLADREMLERALFNLLSNALKFTDQGQVELLTSLQDDALELVVADTGIGIAEEDLPHVFDRFRRGTASATRRSVSSGIGLALVKRMAELHQGQVAASSQKGKGARFTLTLPFVSVATPVQQPASERLPPASRDAVRPAPSVDDMNRAVEAAFDAKKPIVLYVEDDAELRLHVRDGLDRGYNLFVACDGRDGLEKARRYCPDAIITDQMMPRMNGREFLAALRDDEGLRSTPVVFLTAQHGTEGRIESLAAGADDYITKPFHEAELHARVENLIRARRQERELSELNRRLHLQVQQQLGEIAHVGELEQFLPRPLIDGLRHGPGRGWPAPLRRPISVLVMELSALAAFAELLDVPAAAAIVDRYVGEVAGICTLHGGLIDSFAGGRVSALFGTMDGSSPEDAAWAAAQAAHEIRQATLRLNADARRRGLVDGKLRGIGIASGACVIGAFGGEAQRTYTGVGPAARGAALAESSAAPRAAGRDRLRRGDTDVAPAPRPNPSP